MRSKQFAREIGYPLMSKAAAGGGGKGMRVVTSDAELDAAWDLTRGEAKAAFGDERVFVERFIQRPRHVEAQILADRTGRVVFLGERECSVQRRHQKLLEETPSPAFDAQDAQEVRRGRVPRGEAGRLRVGGHGRVYIG